MDFNQIVQVLIGLKCWGAVVGEGTGSIFSLKIGDKIPRIKPIPNRHLTEDVRNNDSEYGILVYSSWKLFQGKKFICDSESPNDNDGEMVKGLEQLIEKKVERIGATEIYKHLKIVFTDNYILKIFSNGRQYGEDYDSYILFLKDYSYTVEVDRTITKEIIEKE